MNNKNQNLKLPPLPDEIIKAIDNRKLIIFIGAGVSCSFGLPTWKDMAETMLQFSHEKNKINPSEKIEIMKKAENSKMLLTIIEGLFKDDLDSFNNEIKSLLKVNKKEIQNKTNMITQLVYFDSPIITTNYDDIIDKQSECCHYKVYLDCLDLKEEWAAERSLVHLHGSVNKPDSMIITTPQYTAHYNNPEVLVFLEKLFDGEYTILFIGYGLAEMEILRHIVRKNGKEYSAFALKEYEENQEPTIKHLDSYYNALNIEQIPYIDNEEYTEFSKVIKHWINEFESKTLSQSTKIKELDDIISSIPNDNSLERIKQILSGPTIYRNHFFRAISKNKNASQWILSLKDEKYMKSEFLLKELSDDTVSPVWFINSILDVLKMDNSDYFKIHVDNLVEEIMRITVKNNNFKNTIRMKYFHGKILYIIFKHLNNDENLLEYVSSIYHIDIMDSIAEYLDDNLTQILNADVKIQTWVFSNILKICANNLDEDNYGFNEITKSFLDKLSPEVMNSLFDLIYNSVIEVHDKLYQYRDLGSVKEYVNNPRPYSFYKVDILKWLVRSIECISEDKLLEFISNGLNDKRYFLKQIALHAINLRYDNNKVKSLFNHEVSFDEFSFYAELYDLIKTNVANFSDDEIESIINKIENANFGHKDNPVDLIKKYRYDLIQLFPGSPNSVEPLSENITEDSEKYLVVHDRGKSWWCSTSSPIEDMKKITQCFANPSEFLDYILDNEPKTEYEKESFVMSCSKYIHENPDLLIDNLESFVSYPIEYVIPLLDLIEITGKNEQDVYRFYENIIETSIKNNSNYKCSIINSFNKRCKEDLKNKSTQIKILIDLAEKHLESFKINGKNISDDLLSEMYNNWYILIYLTLIKYFDLNKEFKDYKEKIIKMLDLLLLDEYENKRIVKAFIALHWNRLKSFRDNWLKGHIDTIFEENDYDLNVVHMFLKGSHKVHYDEDVLDYLYKKIFRNIIELDGQSNVENLSIVQYHIMVIATFRYISKGKEPDDVLKLGMAISNDALIWAILVEIKECFESNEYANIEFKIDSLFGHVCEGISSKNKNPSIILRIIKVVNLFETITENEWSTIIKLSSTVDYDIDRKIITTLNELVSTYPHEVTEVAKNFACKGLIMLSTNEFETLVKSLKDNPSVDRKSLRIICNAMMKIGQSQFKDFM